MHRHLHRKLGTVYAHKEEIDAWRKGRRHAADHPAPPAARQDVPAPGRLMIAVLPFEYLSGADGPDHLGDGLTEDVIVELGRLDPLRLGVIARTTVRQVKAAGRTIRQIGDALGVDFVLEGRVRHEAGRVRVTTQLIEIRHQSQVWAASYDQAVGSILLLQREIACDIARGIRLNLPRSRETRFREARPVEPESYYAYLRGRHFLAGFTSEAVRNSVECLRRAIALDPTHAAAHAVLAEAYAHLSVWADVPTAETVPLAIDAAQSALALDPDLADAHASLGLVYANYVWDWPKAERYFERALELDPGCPAAGQWYAELLAELGRFDRALAIVDRAGRHDPLSLGIRSSRAFVLWLGRRFDEAIAEAERVLEIDERYPMALIRLGVARAAKGMFDEAAEAFRAARDSTPGLLDCASLLGYAHGRAGRTGEAAAALEELRAQAARRYVPSFLFANIHLGLGDHAAALRCIEEELQHRGWYLLLIGQSPFYDPLRSDPRFQALLRRMDFPD